MNKWHGFILALTMLGNQVALADEGRYVVAKSGGDFTTISDALAQGSNCYNPVVIDIMPGAYNENLRLTGSNACTHLRGAGKGLTTIVGVGGKPVISTGIQCVACPTPSNIMVSGVTVRGTGEQDGIYASYGTITLSDSRVTKTRMATGAIYGTMIVRDSVIDHNVSGAGTSYGSMRIESSVISDNSGVGISGALYVVGNLIQRNGSGITVRSQPHANPNANISGNTITNNKGNGMYIQSYGTLVIKNNKITGNGEYDVNASGITSSDTTLAFNTFDTIYPANLSTVYNIKSDGTPWP